MAAKQILRQICREDQGVEMMNEDDYPRLYRYSDSASRKAQKTYLFFNNLHLISLVLGSALGTAAILTKPDVSNKLFTVMAIVLLLGVLVLWIARSRQYDKIWFDGRAVAESVKTATWRFMMKVPPFYEDDKVEERFVFQLKEIRGARPDLVKHMAAVKVTDGLAITDFMRDMRKATLQDRRVFYVNERLTDQKLWYAEKANLNATRSALWFWTVTALQSSAVVLAVIQAASMGFGINMVPVITTCAAAVSAWAQMKRYDELAQSYAFAAQGLEELQSISNSQTALEEFAQFIEQAEDSISREHTMWCARRDVRLTATRAD